MPLLTVLSSIIEIGDVEMPFLHQHYKSPAELPIATSPGFFLKKYLFFQFQVELKLKLLLKGFRSSFG